MFKKSPEQMIVEENTRLAQQIGQAIKKEDYTRVDSLITAVPKEQLPNVLARSLPLVDSHWTQSYLIKSALTLAVARKDISVLQIAAEKASEKSLLEFARMTHDAGWTEGTAAIVTTAINGAYFQNNSAIMMIAFTADLDNIKALYARACRGYDSPDRHFSHAAEQGSLVLGRLLSVVDVSSFHANQLAGAAIKCLYRTPIDISLIENLLDAKMNVNYESGAVMTAVLAAGYVDLARRMIDQHQFETDFFQSNVYPSLLKHAAPAEALAFAKEYALRPKLAVAEEGFQMLDDVSISRTQALPNNGILTTIFNFGTAQQILIAQMGEQVAPPAIVNFAQIQTNHLLKAAASAFVARGGSVDLVVEAGLPAPIAKAKKGLPV